MWLSARQICEALDGTWQSHDGMAYCPAHADDTASLHISEAPGERTIFCCQAGCSNTAVLDALRDRGLWGSGSAVKKKSAHGPSTGRSDLLLHGKDQSTLAKKIWDGGKPLRRTLGEKYLRNRGIRIPLPASLRFREIEWHPRELNSFPALVARLDDSGPDVPFALQRTYLDGPSKAPIEAPRVSLGRLNGSSVRLAAAGYTLGLAEGLESALSAMQLFSVPVWATLGNKRLPLVHVPKRVKRLVIFADHDTPGLLYAEKARQHFVSLGLRVEIMRPDRPETDWNDELLRRTR